MNAQKDPKDIADDLISDLAYTRTLLNAAEDKVDFYLKNRKLLGPREELLCSCAAELGHLLALMDRFLTQMDEKMDAAADLLYGIAL